MPASSGRMSSGPSSRRDETNAGRGEKGDGSVVAGMTAGWFDPGRRRRQTTTNRNPAPPASASDTSIGANGKPPRPPGVIAPVSVSGPAAPADPLSNGSADGEAGDFDALPPEPTAGARVAVTRCVGFGVTLGFGVGLGVGLGVGVGVGLGVGVGAVTVMTGGSGLVRVFV